MTFGNQIIRFILSKIILRKFIIFLFNFLGGATTLKFLSVLNLRWNVSSDRKHLEKKILPYYISNIDPALLLGVKSYNYHYILAYSVFRNLDVIEPNKKIICPQGSNWYYLLIQEWRPKHKFYGFIDCIGVYGYGLNKPKDLILALNLFSKSLIPQKGSLLFSINLDHDPLNLKIPEIRQVFFSKFRVINAWELNSMIIFNYILS